MEYTSFEKFNEISDNFFNFFENALSEMNVSNISYAMNTNIVLGNQQFVADVLNSTTKNKFTPKDIFEIDLVLSSLLSVSKIYDLSYYIKKDSSLEGKELLIEHNLKKEMQPLKIKPSNKLFIGDIKKIKKRDEVNYIVEGLNDEIIVSSISPFGIDEKQDVANRLRKKYNRNMIEAPKWDKLFDFANESLESLRNKEKLSLACISINLEELKELYNKQLSNIKKIYKYKAFKSSLFTDNSSSKEYVYMYKDNQITYNDKKIELMDWSFVDSLKDSFVSENVLKHLNCCRQNKSIIEQIDINNIEFLLIGVENDKVDLLIDKFFEINRLDFTLEYKIMDLFKLYNIEESLYNNGNIWQLQKKDNFLLYQLINKNYDFQHRSLKLLDRLFEKFPDFILNVREEKREIVTDFINNINEEKFSYYKMKFQKYLTDLNQQNIKVKIHNIEKDITIINFNNSAIFNFSLKSSTIKNNMEFFKKENIANIVDDITVSTKVNRIVVGLYFKEELDNDLKEIYISKFIEILKNSECLNKENKHSIDNYFTAIKRKFMLENDLNKNISDNTLKRKKI